MKKNIKLDKETINKVIEDFNLLVYQYSSLTLTEMKNLNQNLRFVGGLLKNVKVSIYY